MFFKSEDGTKKDILPIRVKYVYYDEEYQFRSIPFYNQRLFMQIIKEDENISYYNYIHKRDNATMTTKVAVKPDGEALELSGLTFRKQVTEFLEDCPEIVAKLDAKEYRFKDHEKLFADYNDCDQKLIVSSTSPTSAVTTAAVVTTTVSATEPERASVDDSQQEKLSRVDEFRKYVIGLDGFAYSNDVLEWLSDVENRVTQNREIPNYLWNSLNSMTQEKPELQGKAEKLKKDLE
jgi:hypothetical protein